MTLDQHEPEPETEPLYVSLTCDYARSRSLR
jgi:hypothetical protein